MAVIPHLLIHPPTPRGADSAQTAGTDADRTSVDPRRLTENFYRLLRREVMEGNPHLDADEQALLASHYPVMMAPERYPPPLVTTIYTERRAPAAASILASEEPLVFDAGSGYGSESFLFAALGARVLAVDRSADQTAIARKRQPYWEERFERPLEIHFETADLNTYRPCEEGLSLTWIASVLAALPDQDAFLRRIHGATRPGGEVMITDMNLLNPLFLLKEWRRRRHGALGSPAFARQASLWRMFLRRERRGARYFESSAEEPFDDAQFFWWKTLAEYLRRGGFEPGKVAYSGFMPPLPGNPDLSFLETALAKVPLLRCGAYFYRISGFKSATDPGAP